MTKIMKFRVLQETVNTLKAHVGLRRAVKMTKMTKMKKTENPARVKGRAIKKMA